MRVPRGLNVGSDHRFRWFRTLPFEQTFVRVALPFPLYPFYPDRLPLHCVGDILLSLDIASWGGSSACCTAQASRIKIPYLAITIKYSLMVRRIRRLHLTIFPTLRAH